jgi:hypothetical protein
MPLTRRFWRSSFKHHRTRLGIEIEAPYQGCGGQSAQRSKGTSLMWSKWLETTLERATSVEDRTADRDRRQRIEPAAESDSFNDVADQPTEMPVEFND